VSIKEIAKQAGVSTATVSRVLNGSDKVHLKTVERVLKVVDKMDYRPNHVARRMRVKPTDSLVFGLIITDMGNPFFSNVAKGVEEVAYKNKFVIMICNTNEDSEKEKLFLNSMLSEKVSGVIIVPTADNNSFFKKVVNNNFPLVTIDRKIKDLSVDTVSIDNKEGGYLATSHLIDSGHKRIGIVKGIKGLNNSEDRFNGYKKALEEAGIPISDELITYGDFVEPGGRKAMEKLLSLNQPPSAVFSTNNLMTLGCIKEIYSRRISIPDDIALVGFDDSTWAEALIPPLTTIRQPGYEIGVNAAELLINRLHNPDASFKNVVLNPQIVVRESCGGNF